MEEITSATSDLLLADWFRRVRESQHMHYDASHYFSRLHYYLGIPTMILTSLVGTAVFASLDKQSVGDIKILVGLVSILASVLATLQTFLGLSERAERHRVTAASYSAIRRQLEMIKTFQPEEKEKLIQTLTDIRDQMDSLAKSSPEVPQKIRDRTYIELKRNEHKRVFHILEAGQGSKKQ
ncbi:MAG TPA: SLATT domain-containing protein [Blastocatellia bacterium]|nr:SLATT domain-containing protein [Blastocatellia bacterium]